MAKYVSYTVGDLKRIIKESAQEFKPKVGPNVERDDKKNSEESYKAAKKAAQDFDGSLKGPKEIANLYDKPDGNATTLDYNPVTPPDEKHKKDIEAQAKGFTSALEEKNGIPKNAEFDTKGKFLKHIKDAHEKRNKEKEELASSGLVGREMDKSKFKKNNLFEAPKPKRLRFKHTTFMNEQQVIDRIPEEYKRDGQKIYMNDNAGNEYIVECVQSTCGIVETNITSHTNKKIMEEQVNRIHELMGLKGDETKGSFTPQEKLNESKEFKNLLDMMRR